MTNGLGMMFAVTAACYDILAVIVTDFPHFSGAHPSMLHDPNRFIFPKILMTTTKNCYAV